MIDLKDQKFVTVLWTNLTEDELNIWIHNVIIFVTYFIFTCMNLILNFVYTGNLRIVPKMVQKMILNNGAYRIELLMIEKKDLVKTTSY